jgi:Ca2+-binding RTX toxin-like protein
MIRTAPLACLLLGALALAPAAEAAAPRVSYAARVLTVTAGAKDNEISVYCGPDGNVRMNKRSPAGGKVGCMRIAEIDIFAGDGDDVVRVGGVDSRFGEASFEGFGRGTGVAVEGGAGNDRVLGSDHAFNLVFGEEGRDRVRGGGRRDILSGGPGDDKLRGLGRRDRVLGKGGDDTLSGGNGPDLVSGNAGNDRLFGDAGGDLLGGGPGMDRLFGGAGADTLVGGRGRDRLRGGPGRDREYQQKPPAA